MNADETKEKLAFPRAVLALLAETKLFGPLVDQAIEDIDAVTAALGERDIIQPCPIHSRSSTSAT